MIASSDARPGPRKGTSWRRTCALVIALSLFSNVGPLCSTHAQAQDIFKPPEEPKLEAPKVPELPEGAKPEEGKKKPKVPMRKVLDHKKQWVVLPRVGYLKVSSTAATLNVDHLTLGVDAQLGIKQKVYVNFEAHLLYINDGSYGLAYVPGTGSLQSFPKGDFSSLVGVGIGTFTHLLDKQEFWTRFGLRVGYLHPFFVPIWLGGDIEKEFRRTRQSYWVITASPAAGVLIPVRAPVGRAQYFPPPVEEGEESPLDIKFFLGAQLSLAFIFAPRS